MISHAGLISIDTMNDTPERHQQMLRSMLTIRRFEERAAADYHAGAIYGVVHSYIGQEAIAVGVCSALTRDDQIISTHRGHGHCLAKGADLKRMMAELYGRQTGYCKGRGGSMHIADFSIGMLGANGIVAGGIAIVTGAALAAQMDGGDRVAVAFFGEGASNAGPFHESINIAANWKLPILYVCENNLYASGTPASETVSTGQVAARAAGYGIPGVTVDGNDVQAVFAAATTAVERARASEGPTLIECKTYRHRGHTERIEVEDRRPPTEVEEWKRSDPIEHLAGDMIRRGDFTQSQRDEVEAQVLRTIKAAVEFAAASPFPEPQAVLEDVYAD